MKKFYIADYGNYGQGNAVSLYVSKIGNVLAEYTDDPQYFDTKEEAEEFLADIQCRSFDYQFSVCPYIRRGEIKAENLVIVECFFEDE